MTMHFTGHCSALAHPSRINTQDLVYLVLVFMKLKTVMSMKINKCGGV